MSLAFIIVMFLFIIVAGAMVLAILVQRPQGGGLASAFGGAGGGSTDTAFGGRTGDALTVTTVSLFVLFLGLALAMNLLDSAPQSEPSAVPPPASAALPDPIAIPELPSGGGATLAPAPAAPATAPPAPATAPPAPATAPPAAATAPPASPPPGDSATR